jgi:regulator of replication initiation timing
MPKLSQEQIDEIEHEIQDLVEEVQQLRDENAALKALVLILRQQLKTD